MISSKAPWHLWDRCGVELEYMIVDKKTLKVLPRADIGLGKDEHGDFVSETEHGPVGLSNELVAHVLEFKCAEPVASLKGWGNTFHKEILLANKKYAEIGAMLLPTACHPFMDPLTETHLWPYESTEIYHTYDRIFNCKGHGWANLQSTHLNLSFSGDEEFGALHAAVRALLPLIPAIAASSPYLDGSYSGYKDARIEIYRHNQERVPSITGAVIPEAVFNYADYDREIFQKVERDIAPFDTEHLLNHFFLNSRGAIARFDRGAVEIRLVDIQECPDADVAIAELETATLKALAAGTFCDPPFLRTLDTQKLAAILAKTTALAEDAVIDDTDYLRNFGIIQGTMRAGDLWKRIFEAVKSSISQASAVTLVKILERGTLSTSLYKALGEDPGHELIVYEYARLAECLAQNTLYEPEL
jgi:gamma-glutamyl:cysteine ligase YbdK (ATP-grasp superfamily)